MHPQQRKLPSQGDAISSQTVHGFVSPKTTRNPFPGSFDELLDGAVKQHSEGERLPGLRNPMFPQETGGLLETRPPIGNILHPQKPGMTS